MRILMLWWILTLLGLLISDRAITITITEKKLSRLTPIDCEKYVYHPQCRGLQAKRRISLEKKSNIMDKDGDDMTVEDDGKLNICVCSYKTTYGRQSLENEKNLGMFSRNSVIKERNDRNDKERKLFSGNVIKRGILNDDDKKLILTSWKQKKKKKKKTGEKWNSPYVAYMFVYM